MTAAADGRSSNTLASAYIAELRAQYPTLPWGKLCTGTNKQMSLCYARQVRRRSPLCSTPTARHSPVKFSA